MTLPLKIPPNPPVESEEEEEEEEEESSEEEEDDDSESESEPKSSPVPTPASKAQPTATAAVLSSEDEESGSDTGPENPVEKPDPNIKPIASEPIDDPLETTNTAKPASRSGGKRTAMREDGDDDKKSKRKSENPEKKGNSIDESKRLFKRLWSEEDEIAVLKGMVDYLAEKKTDPEKKLQDNICKLKMKY